MEYFFLVKTVFTFFFLLFLVAAYQLLRHRFFARSHLRVGYGGSQGKTIFQLIADIFKSIQKRTDKELVAKDSHFFLVLSCILPFIFAHVLFFYGNLVEKFFFLLVIYLFGICIDLVINQHTYKTLIYYRKRLFSILMTLTAFILCSLAPMIGKLEKNLDSETFWQFDQPFLFISTILSFLILCILLTNITAEKIKFESLRGIRLWLLDFNQSCWEVALILLWVTLYFTKGTIVEGSFILISVLVFMAASLIFFWISSSYYRMKLVDSVTLSGVGVMPMALICLLGHICWNFLL